MSITRYSLRSLYWLPMVAFLLFAVLLATAGVSRAADPIKIAMITAKTGEAGKSNSISFEAARFVVDEINEDGGILGRQVELLEYDNLSTPEGSAMAARQAVKDGVVAVVGCNWSSHSKAMAEVLQDAKIPMISHMSTNPAVTRVGDYIFRICYTDSFQGYGLARFAYSDLNTDTAVVLVDISRMYSLGLAETFLQAYKELGGKILWVGEYDSSDVDYGAIMRTVSTYDPDAIFIPGSYEDVGGFLELAYDMRMMASILSADGVGMRLYEYIGKKASGLYYSGHWSRWVDTMESRDFIRLYEGKVGPVQVDTVPMVYDSFMLLRDAMERSNSTDGAVVQKALAQTSGFKGVTGPISFNEFGDPIKPMTLNRLKFGGGMYLKLISP